MGERHHQNPAFFDLGQHDPTIFLLGLTWPDKNLEVIWLDLNWPSFDMDAHFQLIKPDLTWPVTLHAFDIKLTLSLVLSTKYLQFLYFWLCHKRYELVKSMLLLFSLNKFCSFLATWWIGLASVIKFGINFTEYCTSSTNDLASLAAFITFRTLNRCNRLIV